MSDNDAITRPTIEILLERIAEIKTSLDEFRKEHQQANAEMRSDIVEMRSDMEKGFRRLDRKIELHARNVSELYADHKELESRVEALEKEPA